ncbi:MAG: NAD-binding protein [Syntrophomonas sp.]
MESRLKILIALTSLVIIIVLSTIGLAYFEGWSAFTALWVTMATITTTGYGDLVPLTYHGRVFALIIMVCGIGLMTYTLLTFFTHLVEGQVSRIMRRDKTMEAIKRLDNHIIVCGAGRVGSNVAHVLLGEKAPFVLVDNDEEKVAEMEEAGHLVYLGDASLDEVLIHLGIKRARGVVAALPDDAYNVYVTLSARDLNPNLKIVARAEKPETIEKLHRAGANKVISPTQTGGYQLAMAMLKPVTVDLVDTLFTFAHQQLQLEELLVTETSPLANQELRGIFGKEVQGVRVIAIIRNNEVLMNIHGNDRVLPGDTMILIGSRTALEQIEFYS